MPGGCRAGWGRSGLSGGAGWGAGVGVRSRWGQRSHNRVRVLPVGGSPCFDAAQHRSGRWGLATGAGLGAGGQSARAGGSAPTIECGSCPWEARPRADGGWVPVRDGVPGLESARAGGSAPTIECRSCPWGARPRADAGYLPVRASMPGLGSARAACAERRRSRAALPLICTVPSPPGAALLRGGRG